MNVDNYILGFPPATQEMLRQLRATIHKAVPDANEVISYAMPGYKLNSMLAYFAAYTKHIGFYPGAGAIAEFKEELSSYRHAKGSVQFPLDRPLPLPLIAKIVKFRAKQNVNKVMKT